MNLFQMVGLFFILIMITLSITAITQRQLQRFAGIMWVAFWLTALVAILMPNVTRIFSKAIGIGRGVDLVMYCGLLATAIGFFFFYLRYKQLETNITKIVRHMAIQEAKEPERSVAGENTHRSETAVADDNQWK